MNCGNDIGDLGEANLDIEEQNIGEEVGGLKPCPQSKINGI